MGQSANRYSVKELTGLVMTIVDDRLRALARDGEIFRTARGSYEIVKLWPAPRAMSKTEVDGWVVYEAGDQVMRLTPEENRMMAKMSAGRCGTPVRRRGTAANWQSVISSSRRAT